MTYVTDSMRAELAEHKLRQVCNANGVRVFRMATPGTGIMAVDIVFAADRIGLTGDIILGRDGRGLWSDLGYGLGWFARHPKQSEQCLCEKFMRQVWVPAAAKAALESDLQDLVDDDAPRGDDERSRRSQKMEALRVAILDPRSDLGDVARSAEAFWDFWVEHIDRQGPEDLGYGYEPNAAGWLCAIQQRFAELWAERERRIEEIVAGWEWTEHDTATGRWARLKTHLLQGPRGEYRTAVASVHSEGTWTTEDSRGLSGLHGAGTYEACKAAARAAVLRQAKEQPELWHCHVEGDPC